MKKILCFMLMMFVSIDVFAASTDDIMNACYPVTGYTAIGAPKCGAKGAIQDATKYAATVIGAVGGGTLGKLFGPVGQVVGIAGGGYAGYLVGENIGGTLAHNYNANEYIYLDNGHCLECDTYQTGEHWECPNGTVVSTGTDWFTCRTANTGDYWTKFTPAPCPGSIDKSVKNSQIKIRATVAKPAQGVSGVGIYSGDVCLEISCGNGVLDKNKNECVAKGGNNDGGNNGGNNSQTCREGRTTAEGKACCDLPKDVATWKDSKCNCVGGKEFKIVNGTGQCVVAESNDGTPFVCPPLDLSLFNQWEISCASHEATMNLITEIKTLCASGKATAKQYNDLYVKLTASVAINCQQTVVIEKEVIKPDNSQARAAIISAGGVLDSIVAGFGKANVWKNAQGEFNTARLASDSIAAVVLGTAGGLITSSVMKKHQVEDGFEDLKCVIGGQPVAGWGDEFRVGIQ